MVPVVSRQPGPKSHYRTSWDLQRDGVNQLAGTRELRGVVFSLGGGSKGCAGQFYSVGNPSGQGSLSLGPAPGWRGHHNAAGVPKLASLCHCIQFFPVVLADLIMAGELLQAGPGFNMLITWWQQECCTPRQQHVPDAMGVVIVVTGHQRGVDGNGQSSHGDARQEIEDPALPRSGVAVAPVPTAVHLERIVT